MVRSTYCLIKFFLSACRPFMVSFRGIRHESPSLIPSAVKTAMSQA
jgi:hypothetical protein